MSLSFLQPSGNEHNPLYLFLPLVVALVTTAALFSLQWLLGFTSGHQHDSRNTHSNLKEHPDETPPVR